MTTRMLSMVLVSGLAIGVAGSEAAAQEVAKRTAKRAAREATESAAKQKAEEAAKKAAKKALAPDAVDLNTAPPDVLAKLGLDEATAGKLVAARPFSGLDDPKLAAVVPAETLKKLEGKVTVKPATPAPGATPPAPAATPAQPPAEPK
jgi:DNA uptake protein ComE-like DNA-binding protein